MLAFNEYFNLSEGGNIFGDKTAKIKKEHIDSTLKFYFKEMSRLFPQKRSIFSMRKFKALGSVGKKAVSGDIDLAISTSDIVDKKFSDAAIKKWNLDPIAVQAEYAILTKRAKTAKPEALMMKAFLKELGKYINMNSAYIEVEEKKTTPGNMFGYTPQVDEKGKKLGVGVQIDWMVGNLKWLAFSYYSAALPEPTNVKGLHRTQLMLSAFQAVNLSFNHVDGVKDKDTGEIIATDPTAALDELSARLNLKLTQRTVENYYVLNKALRKLPKAKYGEIVDIYLKILDRTRADIPDDLHQEWIDRKQKLNLTGKFLPDDSTLRKHI
jgi:hypothetical protein